MSLVPIMIVSYGTGTKFNRWMPCDFGTKHLLDSHHRQLWHFMFDLLWIILFFFLSLSQQLKSQIIPLSWHNYILMIIGESNYRLCPLNKPKYRRLTVPHKVSFLQNAPFNANEYTEGFVSYYFAGELSILFLNFYLWFILWFCAFDTFVFI